jgi:two-component system, NtrC family, sensor kinase
MTSSPTRTLSDATRGRFPLRRPPATAARLVAAFGSLVLVFAIAAGVTLGGLAEIRDGMGRMKDREEGVRIALRLASAVRDQYAHQAHTIIIGDRSHLGLYADAERRVRDLTALVRRHAEREDERAWVDDIERASTELDLIFRDRIVPAVVAGRRDEVRAEHDRAQRVVDQIQERTELLVSRFQSTIDDVHAQAAGVQRRSLLWMAILLLGAPILAAAVGVAVFRSVARPLARLREGAERIAGGDLDAQVDVTLPDEFGALAGQLNAMTAAVKEHQAQLVQSEKLAGIGRLAAGVAHEINNPLGVILGYVQLLRRRAEGGLAEDLGVVEEEALRAKEIVEGLLDLARPQRGRVEPVALRALADEVVRRLAEARQTEGVAVRVDGAATAEGDAQRLRQVLLNLVRNGAEAAGVGGTVTLRIAEAGDAALVAVSDTGRGLDPAVRDRLFEPFLTTKPKGTGLGLAVSRAIARAHGGDIEADAAPEGGAQFTLRLPRAPLAAPRAADAAGGNLR